MAPLEAFPDEPFTAAWFRRLEDSPKIARLHVCYQVGEHRDDPHAFVDDALVVQFVAIMQHGRAVAAHFDPVTRTWDLLDRVLDVDADYPDDVSDAIVELDELLQEERGDDQEYGEAVCVELKIWEPERAEVYRRE